MMLTAKLMMNLQTQKNTRIIQNWLKFSREKLRIWRNPFVYFATKLCLENLIISKQCTLIQKEMWNALNVIKVSQAFDLHILMRGLFTLKVFPCLYRTVLPDSGWNNRKIPLSSAFLTKFRPEKIKTFLR